MPLDLVRTTYQRIFQVAKKRVRTPLQEYRIDKAGYQNNATVQFKPTPNSRIKNI